MPPSLEPLASASPSVAAASLLTPVWLAAIEARGLRLERAAAGDGQVNFPTCRPDQATVPLVTRDGARVVAKFAIGGRGGRTFANMLVVWNSSFGQGRVPPGLPRPIEYWSEGGALLMERLEGRPLAEDRAAGPDRFDAAVRLLAELHGSDARPETERGSRAMVRSVERKAARIAELAPTHATLAHEVAAAMAAARVKEIELVPSHGDFSPRNVLVVGPERLALIDWDRLQLADPARDVAYFGTSDWADWLRRGRAPNRDRLERAVEVYQAARPGVRLKRSLNWHVAAGCVRRAASVLELWPDQSWLAPAWLRTALRELGGAR